jgi:hypothetical protein
MVAPPSPPRNFEEEEEEEGEPALILVSPLVMIGNMENA